MNKVEEKKKYLTITWLCLSLKIYAFHAQHTHTYTIKWINALKSNKFSFQALYYIDLFNEINKEKEVIYFVLCVSFSLICETQR